ncbi:hypothetical protein PV325_006419, partial [Microctonus aethiopoides]
NSDNNNNNSNNNNSNSNNSNDKSSNNSNNSNGNGNGNNNNSNDMNNSNNSNSDNNNNSNNNNNGNNCNNCNNSNDNSNNSNCNNNSNTGKWPEAKSGDVVSSFAVVIEPPYMYNNTRINNNDKLFEIFLNEWLIINTLNPIVNNRWDEICMKLETMSHVHNTLMYMDSVLANLSLFTPSENTFESVDEYLDEPETQLPSLSVARGQFQ